MALVRSLIFAMIFYPGTLGFVLSGMVASLFGTRPMRAVVYGWVAFNRRLCASVLGIHSEIEGAVPTEPGLVAVKHQSMYETMEMVRITRTPVIVVKRELADMPLFGWMTRRYGVIPVDRSAGAQALRAMVVQGRAAIAAGRPILIFPEGTRVPVGQTPPLRSGFAGLYRALGLSVTPVAVDSGRFFRRGLVKQPGVIRFQVSETIPPGLSRDAIEARVHAAINAFELGAEAGAEL